VEPLFAAVETIKRTRPRAALLENVAGMAQRYTHVDGVRMTCLKRLLGILASELSDYLLCVVPPQLTTPTAQGLPISRPREYFMLGRKEVYNFASDAHFCGVVLAYVTELFRRVSSLRPPASFLRGLHRASPAELSSYTACSCTVSKSCSLHPCGCRAAHMCECVWREEHTAAWRDCKHFVGYQEYFRFMWEEHGIDAGRDLKVHRKRDLVNLVFASRGRGVCMPSGVLDTSQAHTFAQFRSDGTLPTLTATSEVFSMGLGRLLHTAELFDFMGFPPTYDVGGCSRRQLTAFLGNTMHVDIVGSLIGVLLAARA
jgi:hypothetical protein